jgi:hypothetical protein
MLALCGRWTAAYFAAISTGGGLGALLRQRLRHALTKTLIHLKHLLMPPSADE